MIWAFLTLSVTLDDGWIGAVWWLDRNEGLDDGGEMVEGTNERKTILDSRDSSWNVDSFSRTKTGFTDDKPLLTRGEQTHVWTTA